MVTADSSLKAVTASVTVPDERTQRWSTSEKETPRRVSTQTASGCPRSSTSEIFAQSRIYAAPNAGRSRLSGMDSVTVQGFDDDVALRNLDREQLRCHAGDDSALFFERSLARHRGRRADALQLLGRQSFSHTSHEQCDVRTLSAPVSMKLVEDEEPETYAVRNDATIDLKTRRMRSDSAVTGTVRQGQFSANQLSADLDNHVVTLDGRARLRIVPRKTK